MLKMISLKRIQGFTFTEMMVALLINAVLFAAITTIFTSNLKQYNVLLNKYRLDQDLQVAMNIMITDIRRAGYWANADTDIGSGTNNNPFQVSGTTDLQTGLSGACILFTYDHAGSGTLPAISASIDDDRYGYRLNGTTLQSRPPGATFSCAAAANAWENMTDPDVINITALSFTINSSTVTSRAKALTVRSVTISITGNLVSNTAITETLTNTVKVRNDLYTP